MRVLAIMLMLLLPIQTAEPQEPQPGDRCYSDTRCSGDSSQAACLAEKRAALARCLAGGDRSSGSQSSSESTSDQSRQQALNALSSAIGELESSMEQSRRDSAARREAEAEQREWEEQQYARSSSSGSCAAPEYPASHYKRAEKEWQKLADMKMESDRDACERGKSWCGDGRDDYTKFKRTAQEMNCLAGKAEQIERREILERRLASFSLFTNPDYELLMPAGNGRDVERGSANGVRERLQQTPELANPACLVVRNGDVANNCESSIKIAWHTAVGPCEILVGGHLPCSTSLVPGERFSVVVEGLSDYAKVVGCLSPSVPWGTSDDRYGCGIWERQPELQAERGSVKPKSDPSMLEPEVRRQIGNKAFLASEDSLSRLRERAAISDYGFDKDLLANQCVESYYETYSSGTKSSRFKNNCNRKIVISWFDSDGWCKERSDADWTCSTGIGPNQVVGTSKQPEGTRREYGACFDPGLPVRRGSEYGCAAWSKMGGSDYIPGEAIEWVERLTVGN